jgi:hypothetical protein
MNSRRLIPRTLLALTSLNSVIVPLRRFFELTLRNGHLRFGLQVSCALPCFGTFGIFSLIR